MSPRGTATIRKPMTLGNGSHRSPVCADGGYFCYRNHLVVQDVARGALYWLMSRVYKLLDTSWGGLVFACRLSWNLRSRGFLAMMSVFPAAFMLRQSHWVGWGRQAVIFRIRRMAAMSVCFMVAMHECRRVLDKMKAMGCQTFVVGCDLNVQ